MTGTQESIRETVKDFIVTRFLKNNEAKSLNYDTPLISGGLIDSILTMQLVVFLETTYHFEFSAHEVDRDNLNTINIIRQLCGEKVTWKALRSCMTSYWIPPGAFRATRR